MTHPAFLAKVTITTGVNDVIRITENVTTYSATIAQGTYTLKGDGAADDLALAVKTALDATAGGNTYTITVVHDVAVGDRCCYVDIARNTGADSFNLLWSNASTTFDEALLGFTNTSTGLGTSHAATLNPSCVWISNDHTSEIEPFSTRDAVVNRTLDGTAYGLARSARMQSWRIGLVFVHEERCMVARALADDEANTIEGFIEQWGVGGAFVLHEAESTAGVITLSSSTVVGAMHFAEETVTRFEAQRLAPGVPLYSIALTTHSEV